MGFGGNVGSALHQLDLFRRLQHAHLVNDRRGIDDGSRRMNRLAIERAHLRNLADDRVVEIGVDAEAVVKFVSAVENVLKLLFKLRDREMIRQRQTHSSRLQLRRVVPPKSPVPDRAGEQTSVYFCSPARSDDGD